MDDHLNLSMFRAYDVRTPSDRLSPELAARLARAEARYFQEVLGASGVVIAHDARATGPHYLQITASVFRAAGLEVLVLPGPCSTSYLYYASLRYPTHAAIMIGASHNPKDDTGHKIVGPGVRPIAEGIGPEGGLTRIKEFYLADQPQAPLGGGRVRAVELMPDYIEDGLRRAGVAPGSLAGMALLQDFLSGSAAREMMLAFDRAGADLVPLHFAADGRFPLGDPNPVKEEVIRPGLDLLQAGTFALGMFFDGDGDRLDVYRGDGTYLASSFVYVAILPEIRRRFPGPGWSVFADLKSNPLAVIEMARTGVAVDVVRNGHSQIKQALGDAPGHFGAVEESAHFYEAFEGPAGRACTENTLYFALLLARAWHEAPERFDALIALQATTNRAREWGHKFPSASARDEALAAVREHFEASGARTLTQMKNGMELDAALMRRGLPFEVNTATTLGPDWLQVCQRTSQSEDGLARWEALGANPEHVREARRAIASIVARHGAGPELQG